MKTDVKYIPSSKGVISMENPENLIFWDQKQIYIKISLCEMGKILAKSSKVLLQGSTKLYFCTF